jgi:peptidoglycan/LPS O-acetylase OafA/YrhL
MIPAPPHENRSPRVDELDGLRGLLALWVAVAHIFAWCGYWELNLPARLQRGWETFITASAAVDTFIILSGFAISFLLNKRTQTYRTFMIGRFFRIYPVYGVCLLLGIGTTYLTPAILSAAGWNQTIYFEWIAAITQSSMESLGAHTAAHLTLLNGMLPNRILENASSALLTPAWSITLEWQYYLVAPLIARCVRSGGGILALTASIWVAMAAIQFLGGRYGWTWQNSQDAFLPGYLPLFLIGIGSYHFYARFRDTEMGNPLPAIAVASLLALGILLKWHTIALTAWALGFGCILVRGSGPLAFSLSLIRRCLLHPALQWLGNMSFPLYLIHWPVIVIILAVALRVVPGLTSLQALLVLFVIGIPAILISSRLMHCFLELPMMAVGKKITQPAAKQVG